MATTAIANDRAGADASVFSLGLAGRGFFITTSHASRATVAPWRATRIVRFVRGDVRSFREDDFS
jgi:hypothetical protein